MFLDVSPTHGFDIYELRPSLLSFLSMINQFMRFLFLCLCHNLFFLTNHLLTTHDIASINHMPSDYDGYLEE